MYAFIAAAKEFARDDAGVTAIEYGLIAAVMAAGVVASVGLLKQPLIDTFTSIKTSLTSP
ncbi:MAG TPA: Flp family type IVb pilin [Burkholderiaceae bacterium]|jgi:pilus assembly protein Flp/PilA|nr:Flp family type IVb pilin [Burkholderiaceae bacterium]